MVRAVRFSPREQRRVRFPLDICKTPIQGRVLEAAKGRRRGKGSLWRDIAGGILEEISNTYAHKHTFPPRYLSDALFLSLALPLSDILSSSRIVFVVRPSGPPTTGGYM